MTTERENEVREIFNAYRANNKAYSSLASSILETKAKLVELDRERKELAASMIAVRDREQAMYDSMAAAGEDVDAFKREIMEIVKNLK